MAYQRRICQFIFSLLSFDIWRQDIRRSPTCMNRSPFSAWPSSAYSSFSSAALKCWFSVPLSPRLRFCLCWSHRSSLQHFAPLNPALKSKWLVIHTVVAFLGYASFAVAFGAAIIYLMQERFLKRRKIGGLFQRLPSLDTLDEINYRCLTFGFPLLTVAIISGAIWAETAWGTYWSWDPKETWSLITWFVYAALLHGTADHRLAGEKSGHSGHHRFLCHAVYFPWGESVDAGTSQLQIMRQTLCLEALLI